MRDINHSRSSESSQRVSWPVRLLRRLIGDDRGATLAYFGVSLPVIIGFAGLGVDVTMWQLDDRKVTAMADAGANAAGVSVIRTNSLGNLTTYATVAAGLNGYDADLGHELTIHNPPSIGPLSAGEYGDPDGDGVSGHDDAIEVVVRIPTESFFTSLLSSEQRYVSARAVVMAIDEPGDMCFMSLDPDGGITVGGTAEVTLDCGALSNGDVDVNGSACLEGTNVTYADDDLSNTNCPTTTDPMQSIGRPDPLRFLEEPEDRVCDKNSATIVTNGETEDFYPEADGYFVFCNDVVVNNGGRLNLHAGVYIFHGANFSVSGHVQADEGVMIYVSEDASVSDTVSIAGSGSLVLNAMDNDTMDTAVCKDGGTIVACNAGAVDDQYEGIAFFASREATEGLDYNFAGGSDMVINGIVYVPNGDVNWAGGQSSSANAVIADNISVVGNSEFGTIEGTILETLLAYTYVRMVE